MLNGKTDAELVALYIEKGNDKAGEIIWCRYRSIVYAAVRQYFGTYKKWVGGLSIEDMRQLAAEHFITELIASWNPARGKLSGFTSVSMRNFCLYHLKRFSRHKRKWELDITSINELIYTDAGVMDYADILKDETLPDPADIAVYNELKSAIESAISKLSRKHQEIYNAMLLETGVFSTENPYLSKFTTHYIQVWRTELIDALRDELPELYQQAK